eukprot:gnl/TRDRNA2_/TRDRNA2_202857_c0_seq1.p1 gnl/TRDRNA2_/TRDRNA2_202857_c0~~gnl/TRDRNA2_/TRDRNA2_202857_c0_seq1.p1  ORF type:complete len:514 (-),score=79.53 gnl/TRDRNA2_/TRDRNA2_202857_c0_seq1:157-1698(-)
MSRSSADGDSGSWFPWREFHEHPREEQVKTKRAHTPAEKRQVLSCLLAQNKLVHAKQCNLKAILERCGRSRRVSAQRSKHGHTSSWACYLSFSVWKPRVADQRIVHAAVVVRLLRCGSPGKPKWAQVMHMASWWCTSDINTSLWTGVEAMLEEDGVKCVVVLAAPDMRPFWESNGFKSACRPEGDEELQRQIESFGQGLKLLRKALGDAKGERLGSLPLRKILDLQDALSPAEAPLPMSPQGAHSALATSSRASTTRSPLGSSSGTGADATGAGAAAAGLPLRSLSSASPSGEFQEDDRDDHAASPGSALTESPPDRKSNTESLPRGNGKCSLCAQWIGHKEATCPSCRGLVQRNCGSPASREASVQRTAKAEILAASSKDAEESRWLKRKRRQASQEAPTTKRAHFSTAGLMPERTISKGSNRCEASDVPGAPVTSDNVSFQSLSPPVTPGEKPGRTAGEWKAVQATEFGHLPPLRLPWIYVKSRSGGGIYAWNVEEKRSTPVSTHFRAAFR